MAGGKRIVASAIWLICLLSSFLSSSLAQEVMASNSTSDLSQPGSARYILNSTDTGIPKLRLVPLTHVLAFLSQGDFTNVNITGQLLPVGDNINVIRSGDIAFISCDADADPGQLNADTAVAAAISGVSPPSAVILYSTEANHCNFSSTQTIHYDSLFTTIDPTLAGNLVSRLQNTSTHSTGSILPDLSSLQQIPNASGNSNNNGSSNSSNNGLGPSSTTAVCMVVLFSVTGIITALVLIIIVAGAIRAHRTPERYGPRNSLGRPRQSRAKGLARAMLETLPIVKFNDQNEKPAPNADNVELGQTVVTAGDGSADEGKRPSTEMTAAGDEEHGTHDNDTRVSPVTGVHSNASHEDNTLGCSICTEDFVKGQDIRVLPCDHKFHPECVDPWLLNVSGTCPLCRVDLRPTISNVSEPAPDGAGSAPSATSGDLPPPLDEIAGAANPATAARQRGSLAVYFHNLRHMRDATAEERLAELRRLHSANQEAGATGRATDVDRERRLSTRLRDAFRIRTRRQEGDNASVSEAEPQAEPLEQRSTGT